MKSQIEDQQDFWKQVYVASLRNSSQLTTSRLRDDTATSDANAAVESYAAAWGMKMPNLKK